MIGMNRVTCGAAWLALPAAATPVLADTQGSVPGSRDEELLLDNAARTLGAWQVQRCPDEYLVVSSAPIH